MTAVPLHVVRDPDGASTLLHPLRLRLLRELREPDSAAGLARRLRIPRQKLNYHLRQLEAEGLVEMVETRQKRGCTERILRAVARSFVIDPATLGTIAGDPAMVEDQVSSAYLVAVAARAIREVAALRERAEQSGKRIPTVTLQSEIRFASPAAQQAFANDLTRALAELTARYHDEKSAGGRTFRLIAGSYPAPVEGHPTP
jgi:DNA-binding transcriptional ArsR family regulator